MQGKPAMGGVTQQPIRPFKIGFPEQKINDMKDRIMSAVIPNNIDDDDTGAGLRMADFKTLLQYWQHKFSWADVESSLNQLSQFQTEIQGVDLHFIHERSSHGNATPILLLHGWPSSPFEFRKVIPQLTKQERPEDAFHVVAPCLPGFLFSSTLPGLGYTKAATLFLALMERLGYDRYIVYGADFSNTIASMMVSKDAGRHCIGLHLQGSCAIPRLSIWKPFRSLKNLAKLLWPLSKYEKLKRSTQFKNYMTESGYLIEQCTKPRTMGLVVAQSPVAAAAWIAIEFISWSDATGVLIEDSMTEKERMQLYPRKLDKSQTRLEHCKISMDEILTVITLFWLTDSLPTSMFMYRNSLALDPWAIYTDTEVASKVPVAVSDFVCDVAWSPVSWIRQQYHNLVQYKFHCNGGHFPALEHPDALIPDIIEFHRRVRGNDTHVLTRVHLIQ